LIGLLLGGIGLFLLGMALLTDGLRDLAGDALRNLLRRFAGGTFSAMLSGFVLTAVVQSSSATTLATIGFVSAGLLRLPQAIAVIIGANLGTTTTAWIISLIGLKFSVSVVGFPLVGLGALARVLGRERIAAAGSALAGFGLVFVGIDTLQLGMVELATRIDPSSLPSANGIGRYALVGIGTVMTVLMQSSSAAVATTLAAVHSGSVSLAQAAALVIGQNIGTTTTALIGAIGASVPARRTAVAHVAFNIGTAFVALLIFPLFLVLVVEASQGLHTRDPAEMIALFHTSFNVLGALIFIPLLSQLTKFTMWVVKDSGSVLTQYLDPSVTLVPAVAVDAANRALRNVAGVVTESLHRGLAATDETSGPRASAGMAEAANALAEVRTFLDGLRAQNETVEVHARHLDALHAVDHLELVISTAHELLRLRDLLDEPGLAAVKDGIQLAVGEADRVHRWATHAESETPLGPALEASAQTAAMVRRARREQILEETALGRVDVNVAMKQLDVLLAVEHLVHSLWRSVHHLDATANRRDVASEATPIQIEAP
jgi:phosphate:Na+ symporter